MGPGGGRRRYLSDEDRSLWKRVTETAVPLNQTIRAVLEIPVSVATTPPLASPPIPKFRIGQKNRPSASLQPSIQSIPAKNSPNMDGRNFDRLKKGKLPVDGRIDLHGMTLAEAHPALTGFILNASMAGKRLLLVITGKGRTFQGEGLITARRGILKQQVPQWLQLPPLAPLVLQVTQAHGKHGGDGAYYVYLRRQR